MVKPSYEPMKSWRLHLTESDDNKFYNETAIETLSRQIEIMVKKKRGQLQEDLG